MVLSDTSGKAGILQLIESTTNQPDGSISGNATQKAYFTARINQWLHIVSSWIREVEGEWQYDDFNHGDFPIETFPFVDNQQDCGLTATGEKDSLVVRRVEAQYVTSNDWYDLTFLYEKDIPENWDGETKGTPLKYWLSGGSIMFDRPVDTSIVDNYRLTYDRNAHLFTTSDTTAEPGFDQRFHMLLVYGPSMEWGMINGKGDIVALCNKMIYGSDPRRDKGLKLMLQAFYLNRARQAVHTYRKPISWK